MPPAPRGHPAPLAWADWCTAAFARAMAGPRPVALLVETRWSGPCDAFRRTVVADPAVCAALAGRFETIRVDADERPDLAERYTADGWPTLVALTPRGWPMAPAPTDDAAACAARLEAIATAFDQQRDAMLRQSSIEYEPLRGDTAAPDPVAIVGEWLSDWEAADGAVRAAETPGALDVAIELARRAERPDLLARAVAVLDRLAASPLRDAGSGAWFRLAPRGPAGWEAAQALDDQAAWLSAEAAAQDASPADDRARRIDALVRTLERAFAGPLGFANARFVLAPASDATRERFDEECSTDRRVFVDAQARVARAMMRAGAALAMPSWTARAIDRLDAIVAAAYRRDGGVAHVLDPDPRMRGLIGDQAMVASALLDAWDASARPVYLDAADELLQSTLRKFHDRDAGQLRDRVPTTAGAGDVGLLGRPLFPTAANVAAAGSLLRLAIHREAPEWREAATGILAACVSRVDAADPANAALVAALA